MSILWKVEYSIEEIASDIEQEFDCFEGFLTIDLDKLTNLINDVSSDFENIDIYTGGSTYWSGILFLEPWCELIDEHGLDEESIIDYVLKNHISISKKYVRFIDNQNSNLQWFFDKYNDGYGGNIPHNIETILSRVIDSVEYIIKNDPEYYGTWEDY